MMKSENWHHRSNENNKFIHQQYSSAASTTAAAAATAATSQGSKKKSHRFSVVVAKAMHKVRRIFFYKRGMGTGDPANAGALVLAGKRGRSPSVTIRGGSRIRSTSNGSLLPVNDGGKGGSSRRSYPSGSRKTKTRRSSYRSSSNAMIFPYNSLSRCAKVPEKYSSTKIYTRLSQVSGQRQHQPEIVTESPRTEGSKNEEHSESARFETKDTNDIPLKFHRASSYIACLTMPHKYLDVDGTASTLRKQKELENKVNIKKTQEKEMEKKEETGVYNVTAEPELEEENEKEDELDENHAWVPGWTHSIRIEEPYPPSVAEFASSPKKTKKPPSIPGELRENTFGYPEPTSTPSSIAPPTMVSHPPDEDICKVLPLDQAFESIIKQGASAAISVMDHEVVINTYRNKYLADLGYSPTNIFENEPDRKSLLETTECDSKPVDNGGNVGARRVKNTEKEYSFVIDHDGVHYPKQGSAISVSGIPQNDTQPVSANSLDTEISSGSVSSKDTPGNPIMYYFSENSPQYPRPPPSLDNTDSGETLKQRYHQHHTHLGPAHHTVRRRFSASSYSSTSSTQKFQSTWRRHANKPPLKSCIKKKTSVLTEASGTKEDTSLTSISVNQASPRNVTPKRNTRTDMCDADIWEEVGPPGSSVRFEGNRKSGHGLRGKSSLTSLSLDCAEANTSIGTNGSSISGSDSSASKRSRSKRVRFLIDVESVASKSPVLTHLMRRSNVNTSLFASAPPQKPQQNAPVMAAADTSNGPKDDCARNSFAHPFTSVAEAVAASPTYAFHPPHRATSPPPSQQPLWSSAEEESRESSMSPGMATSPALYSPPESPFLTPPSVSPLYSTGTAAAGFLNPMGGAAKLSRLALGTGVHGGFLDPVSAVFGGNGLSSLQPQVPLSQSAQGRRGKRGAAEIGISSGYSGVWGRRI